MTQLLRRTRPRTRGSRKSPRGPVLKRLLISTVLALVLATSVPNYAPVSNVFAADTVCVPANQLNELYAGVDSLLLERRLLQIDLTETRRMATVDSLMFEERMNIYRAREKSWLTKALSHPAIWFMIGAYAGLQAAR